MKKLVMFVLVLFAGQPIFAGVQNHYDGQFDHQNSTGKECDHFFDSNRYHAKLFLTGSAGTTAVVHFEAQETNGFFHRANLTGLNGGLGDIKVENTYLKNGAKIFVVAEGAFDKGFLLLATNVTLQRDGKVVCTATAEFSGFNN